MNTAAGRAVAARDNANECTKFPDATCCLLLYSEQTTKEKTESIPVLVTKFSAHERRRKTTVKSVGIKRLYGVSRVDLYAINAWYSST